MNTNVEIAPAQTQVEIDRAYIESESSQCKIDDWHYEMRREMQEVLPGLYLGPFSASRNVQRLHEIGITHILCFLDQNEQRLFRTENIVNHFNFWAVEVSDSTTQNLIPLFPLAAGHINETLVQGGKILVCCNGGMSRSPSFVIAFIMQAYDLNASQAYQYVQNRRLCINPNDGFKSQLSEYEPIYKARKSNGGDTQQQQFQQQQRRRRRSLGFDDDMVENGVGQYMRTGGELKRRTTEAASEADNVVGPGVSGMALQ
ncbi:protein-tyrosine phosphatase-like protein [Zychaea mexicana]|uniref:protein-tyrosine phosphatase-like protein n=1 Tax=Zychaea mexicana TaxID=64656 RepID=UPI0022FDC5C6|nr:protein-tyrosine phosphatase-like protein [Zychaea mexicana]KAI9494710.1 protein-tyrosine phosphatase-like protein [Zychaea mexicana]